MGRCADFVLRNEEAQLLRVFIRTSLEKRIERKMLQEGLSRERAARLVRKMDKQRKKYYETYTGHTWGDPQMWDFNIDTSTVSLEDAADVICAMYHHIAPAV